MVGRAAGVSGGLPLVEASGRDTRFNYMSCPLNCSHRGRCDLHAFCACDEGYFGLDCGLTRGSDGRPSAWRAAGAATSSAAHLRLRLAGGAAPRPAAAARLDHAIGERILLSHHREADALAADYFGSPGRATSRSPSSERSPSAGHFGTQASRPTAARATCSRCSASRARRDRPATETRAWRAWHSMMRSSRRAPRRQWLALTLNGIADMERGDARKCHVFQPGRTS